MNMVCCTYRIDEQRRLCRDCAFVQSRQNLRCSHTQSRDEDEGSGKQFRPLAPLDRCACTAKPV